MPDAPPRERPAFQAESRLEIQLEAELDQARSAGLANLPKSATEAICVGIQELYVVKRVEHFRPKLERFVLRELGSLEERNIPIIDPRTTKGVSPEITERSQ